MGQFVTIYIYLLMIVYAEGNDETVNLDNKKLTTEFYLFLTKLSATTTSTDRVTSTVTSPVSTDISSPMSTDLPSSEITDISSPEITDVSSPESTDVSSPESTDISSPESTDISSPESTDISSAVNMNTETMTEADRIPADTVSEIIETLTTLFENNTVGLINLTCIDQGSSVSATRSVSEDLYIHYRVTYSVKELSDEKALCAEASGSCLAGQLNATRDAIVSYSESFGHDLLVDGTTTERNMTAVIAVFTEDSIDGVCYKYGDYCSNINNTCFVENGAVTCTDKCIVYTREINPLCTDPKSSLNNIFIPGTCVIKDGNPVCDCGHSLGGIMQNFYDGTQCISSAFVVGIAAGVGGFIIVVLLGVAIGFGCKSSKRERSRKDVIEAYGDSSIDRSNDDLVRQSEKQEAAFDNLTYESRIDSLQQLEEQFPNFQPSLSHIDPTADYTFPRPNISMEHINMFAHAKDRL